MRELIAVFSLRYTAADGKKTHTGSISVLRHNLSLVGHLNLGWLLISLHKKIRKFRDRNSSRYTNKNNVYFILSTTSPVTH